MTDEGRRDESVSFSLKELQKLEDERIERERRGRELARAAEQRSRDEAARRERDALEAKERADAEAREKARATELEEIARREAMQKMLVEQGRIEVEARTRSEERERERRHELELERLRKEGTEGRSMLPTIVVGVASATCTALLGMTIWMGAIKPASDGRVAELEMDLRGANARSADLARQADDAQALRAKVQALQGELTRADGRIRTLEDALAKGTPPRSGAAGHHAPRHGGVGKDAREKAAVPCPPGDPMCFSVE